MALMTTEHNVTMPWDVTSVIFEVPDGHEMRISVRYPNGDNRELDLTNGNSTGSIDYFPGLQLEEADEGIGEEVTDFYVMENDNNLVFDVPAYDPNTEKMPTVHRRMRLQVRVVTQRMFQRMAAIVMNTRRNDIQQRLDEAQAVVDRIAEEADGRPIGRYVHQVDIEVDFDPATFFNEAEEELQNIQIDELNDLRNMQSAALRTELTSQEPQDYDKVQRTLRHRGSTRFSPYNFAKKEYRSSPAL